MPDYKSLALKWRPHTLDDLVGQPLVVKVLRALHAKGDFPPLLLVGSRGTGKCLAESTYVYSDAGILTLEELSHVDNFRVQKENGFGEANCVDIGNYPTYEVYVDHPDSIPILKGRMEHKVRVLCGGERVWKQLSDLRLGDLIILQRGNCIFGDELDVPSGFSWKRGIHNTATVDWSPPLLWNTDWAMFFGLWIGDGGVDSSNNVYVMSNESDVQEWLKAFYLKYFGSYVLVSDKRRKNLVRIGLSSQVIASWFSFLGFIVPSSSSTKSLPLFIRQWPKALISSFLQGYYEADGTPDHLEYSSKSSLLMEQVRIILWNLGIIMHIGKPKIVNSEVYYRANVQEYESYEAFDALVGFYFLRKRTWWRSYFSKRGKRGNDSNILPMLGDKAMGWLSFIRRTRLDRSKATYTKGTGELSHRRLVKLLNYYGRDTAPEVLKYIEDKYVLPVTGIKYVYSGETHCRDLSCDEDHTYIANGVITHNTTSARIISAMFNCERGTAEPCGVCKICCDIFDGRDPDCLEMDVGSVGGVESIRDLKRKASFRAIRAKNKIFILDEVQGCSLEAFNALLKLLEEPRPRTHFMLLTTEPDKIPDTIKSRCFQLNFAYISDEAMFVRLRHIIKEEAISIPSDMLKRVVSRAKGSLRDALMLLEQFTLVGSSVLETEDVAVLNQANLFLDGLFEGKLVDIPAFVDEIANYALFINFLTSRLVSDYLVFSRDKTPRSARLYVLLTEVFCFRWNASLPKFLCLQVLLGRLQDMWVKGVLRSPMEQVSNAMLKSLFEGH